MAGSEDWKKNADTHKTPGHNPGGRRNLPYNPYAMALAGLAVVGGLWYFYNKKTHEARHRDLARVPAGVSDPEDTRHRK
ncbi:hypothetical protein Pfo_010671 [Paulownia fortunei]|nr:hypothetical protein Pfo_010671 [Paulownia fortunei]